MMKLLFLSIFLVSALHQADSNGYYDKILSHSRIRARKEGPNVCALQQIMGTKKKYFSTCRNWHQGAICGKKATVKYECCPGYMILNGQQGCPAVAPIDNVYGTLGIVGALATQDYSDKSDLRNEIEGVGSFTFFAPSNDAWDLLDPEIRGSLLNNVNIELLNALHYHMVNKRLLTKDLKNGLTVESMFNNEKLLINHYPNGIVTVNCARIIHGNQIATNGVVHVIDRVVTAVGNTIQDFVDSEDDLSSLRAASIASNILDKLGEPGHYTLFAPTNEAFEKLPRGVLERIMSDKKAAEALVNYHILDTVQCSEAIMGGAQLDNLEGSSLQVGCDGDSVTINGKKIVNRKDIVTTNGVIHLIDDVLIPDSAKQVMELAGSQQTTFTDLMAQMGLAAALRPEAEYTLLAPLNDAFTDETLKMDQRVLKLIMQNHVLKSKFLLNELYNGQTLETVGGKLLRVFVYRTAVCIENSCMLRGSKEGRNGAIHSFRKVIRPAEESFYDIIRRDRRFSIFLSLMEHADLKDLLTEAGAWTLFLPTNDAFDGLSKEDIESLKKDKVALQNILLYHLAPGVFIGDGFEPGVTNILKSLQGNKIMIISANNSITVNGIASPESDLMASNGVIHVTKKFLFPADLSIGNQQLLTILNKIIKYFTIKFDRSATFKAIPLTKYITVKVIKEPITTITRVIGGGETHRKIIQGSTVIEDLGTTVDIISEPTITKVTKVIQEPEFKVIQGGETRVTKVIQGPEIKYTRVSTGIGGDTDEATLKRMLEEEVTRVSKFIDGDSQLLDDDELKRLLQGGSQISKVTTIVQGEPSETVQISKIVKEPQVQTIRKVQTSRRQQAQPLRRQMRRSHQS